MNIDEQKMKIASRIKCLTSNELIEYLTKKFDAYEIEEENMYNIPALSDSIENFFLIEKNQKLLQKNIEWVLLEIPYTKISQMYYDYDKSGRKKEEKLAVLIEKQTGFINSNSQLLMLELLVEKGIDEDAYNNNSDELVCYLMQYNQYHEIIRAAKMNGFK